MMQNMLMYMFLFFISFFPMVMWAYIFSYMDNDYMNKKSFMVGMTWWMLSVIPMLYMDKILNALNFKYLNMFYLMSQMNSIFSSMKFWLSLFLFLLFMMMCSFFIGVMLQKFEKMLMIYLKNMLVFLLFTLMMSTSLYFLNMVLMNMDFEMSENMFFWEVLFNSFKLMIFYYLLVGFMEESSKYFNFLGSSILYMNSMKTWVLYAMFVALWFSLMENMLYLYNYYIQFWISFELLKLYFFSSIFSVIVHILCSSIVAYYFSKALLLYSWKDFTLSYMSMFSYGVFISMLLHLFFNLAITLGFSFVMFLYFIWGYLYVSSMFYSE